MIGEQFTWHFEYPQAGGKPAVKSDQLYLPIDRSVKFDIVSKDVLHDFWVPSFRMKIDAVPGITTHYRVTPKRLGDYPVVCAELCGLGHAFMRQTAHVLTADAYAAWLAKQGGSAAAGGGQAAAGAPAADGKAIFTSDNFGCGACHTLADAGTAGQTGPNLDKVLKGMSLAQVREDIVSPNKVIEKGYPKDVMPQDFGTRLKPAELDALVAYLNKVTAK